MNKPLRVTRNVSKDDPGNYTGRDVAKGEILYAFSGHTYGCIESPNWAVSEKPGEHPFYEFPFDAIEEI